ncbi:MAG: NAD(P)-dependent dehydrogenase (short-subunit alcohol dehydrogenase family) [Kiritimatiellia bacterium]|jgi:NAD(P)-dependent dehydrogenase (short-subunit alcohol dehydrogenase family)
MDLHLRGRTALVVGASRGLGAAIARTLVDEGANVGLLARDAEALHEIARSLGSNALALPVDVLDDNGVIQAIKALRERWSAPTIVVWCVADRFQHQKLPDISTERVDELLRTDLHAPAKLLARVLPDMVAARHGRIVLLGSLAASHGLRGAPLYGAAKAALEGLCRAIAVDHGRFGVTANVVRLGVVATERLADRGVDVEAWRRRSPSRRLVTVQEVADTVAWLCSERAICVNGAVLDVTSGLHLSAM